MNLFLLQFVLLGAICYAITVRFVSCTDANEAASRSSDLSWYHVLEAAHNSGVAPSTYSSDDVLDAAALELDRRFDLLNRRIRLAHMVRELRHYEPPVYRSGASGSRQYQIHTIIERLDPFQFGNAIKEHFKSSTRKIAVLDDNTIVTSIAAKKPYSPQVEHFSLNGEEAHVLFWNIDAQKTELRFIGLAVVSPPTLVRTLLDDLPKLAPARGNLWDSRRFQFLPPDGLRLNFPLLPKP